MEYVTNFFSIASWMTILVLVASLSAIAAAVIEITKKKKIFSNIAWVAFGLYGIKIGLGLYATDLNAGFFTKHLLSAIEKMMHRTATTQTFKVFNKWPAI